MPLDAPDALQKREIFHLAFLRALGRALPVSSHVLKGGSNLRFFFGSVRYSEDMDLDVADVPVHVVRERVMGILRSPGLADALRIYGIERVEPPDVGRAKQTETVQRFKAHLITSAGEDLATKIEFSRRGLDAPARAEPVAQSVLAAYRMAPLIVPHYAAEAAFRQKLRALVGRRQPEARDVFDLYILSPHLGPAGDDPLRLAKAEVEEIRRRIFSIGYDRYRDTVVSFLEPEDRASHGSERFWDEARLRVLGLLEGGASGGR